MKFATKRLDISRLTLGMLLRYLGKLKKIKFSANIQHMWKKIQTNCILSAPILNSCMRGLTVYSECIYVFYQNLVLVTEYHVHC